MDSTPNIPEIKPEVNKEEKRGQPPGFWGNLLGGAHAGSGGLGGFGGAASGGGMLATKAGLLGLILAGTTVAGGVGLVGYRLFGPGPGDQADGNNTLTLFAAKPKPASAAAGAQGSGPADGNSQSLSMFAQANAPQPGADGAQVPPQNPNAASPSATPANTTAAPGSGNMADGGSGHKILPNTAKFSAMGSSFGGSGGSSAVSAGSPRGELGAFSRGVTGGAPRGGGRASAGLGGRRSRSNGAIQLDSVARDHASRIGTMYTTGATYDGHGQAVHAEGPQAGAPGGPPAPAIADSVRPKSFAPPPTTQSSTSTPPPKAVNVTPHQSEIDTARMLVLAALLLMALKSVLATQPWFTLTAKQIINGIISAIGVAVAVLGAVIASGSNGDPVQGTIIMCAGAGVIAAGIGGMLADKIGNAGAVIGANMSPIIMLGGGAAVLALVGSMLAPTRKVPASQAQNGSAPDRAAGFAMKGMPSEKALGHLV